MAPNEESGGTSATVVSPARPKPQRQFVPSYSGRMRVEVVGGPMDGESCRVTRSVVKIGRGRDNDLALHMDPLVSAHHAKIIRSGEQFWLEDTSSSNGTYLGNQRIETRTPIGPGTLFVIGETCLEFTPV